MGKGGCRLSVPPVVGTGRRSPVSPVVERGGTAQCHQGGYRGLQLKVTFGVCEEYWT